MSLYFTTNSCWFIFQGNFCISVDAAAVLTIEGIPTSAVSMTCMDLYHETHVWWIRWRCSIAVWSSRTWNACLPPACRPTVSVLLIRWRSGHLMIAGSQVARHRVLGTPFFIDKMPNNFIHVGWIKMILPHAKIINTRRHPMDSLLGVYKQLFTRGQSFTYDTLDLSDFYRGYIDMMNHKYDGRINTWIKVVGATINDKK